MFRKTKILEVISYKYTEFIRQATFKINKFIANSSTDPNELVSDVVFSVINKLDDEFYLNKFYKMAEENKLHLYILKGIDSNCRYLNAPFLRSKLKLRNRVIYKDNYYYDKDDEIYTETEEDLLVDYIYTLLSPEKAPEVFGKYHKYYSTIFLEYISEPKISYQTLANKYDIPKPTLASDIMKIKIKIKNYINENYKKHN